jgi:opacity protein-like surface antigen
MNNDHFNPRILLILVFLLVSCLGMQAQDTQTDTLKGIKKIEKQGLVFGDFNIGFYIDVYFLAPLDNSEDTTTIMPLYANSNYTSAFRLNVASFIIKYNAEKTRGNLTFQYGDIPFLLTSVDAQFIKYLRQANFGLRLSKKTWIDLGYMLNPIGVESSWPIYNHISTVTVGGYFEPGNILGVRISSQFTPKFGMQFYVCNPYSVAYQQDNYVSLGLALSYNILDNFTLTYANMTGLQSKSIENDPQARLYNNLILQYYPIKWLNLTGEFDFAIQTNSNIGPDPSTLSGAGSGFAEANFRLHKRWGLSARVEYYDDPNDFLSGYYGSDGGKSKFSTWGYTGGAEFKPLEKSYLRAEFRYMDCNNKVFYNKERFEQYNITVTCGLMF